MNLSKLTRNFGLAVLTLLANGAYASGLHNGSALILDMSESSTTVTVYYPGETSDQCGLRLLAAGRSGGVPAEVVDNLEFSLEVTGQSLGAASHKEAYLYELPGDVVEGQLFGVELMIATKDDSPLSELLDDGETLVVVSTPCS